MPVCGEFKKLLRVIESLRSCIEVINKRPLFPSFFKQNEPYACIFWSDFLFLLKIPFMWAILKAFISLLQYCICFTFWVLAMRHVDAGSWPGINPHPSSEGEVLAYQKSPWAVFSFLHLRLGPDIQIMCEKLSSGSFLEKFLFYFTVCGKAYCGVHVWAWGK